MLYVPYLGPAGLDVTIPMKREGVFHLRVDKTKDPSLDFHPEIVSYCIFSIAHGTFLGDCVQITYTIFVLR